MATIRPELMAEGCSEWPCLQPDSHAHAKPWACHPNVRRLILSADIDNNDQRTNVFFSFDGIDGVGKSTQVRLFVEALRARRYDVVECRDPGSTPLGERIRDLLLTSDADTMIGRRSEMLLYMAARAQLVDDVIRPALKAGKTVVSDRYLLANVVYQGHAGGLDPAAIWQVGHVATEGVEPDCVFVLDMPPEAADRRLNRPLDRIERQGDEYRSRLRAGFLAEAASSNGRIQVVDADREIAQVQADIWRIAAEALGIH
ncbi:MAG: dTMP kinase [Planctomycetes bacterium]|nr:dTMP kinase [Planctomycetota bacterium]